MTAGKVASPEAGAGLPPIIPAGMRAMSVQGQRGHRRRRLRGARHPRRRASSRSRQPAAATQEPMSRTVVSNVQVLTAGTQVRPGAGARTASRSRRPSSRWRCCRKTPSGSRWRRPKGRSRWRCATRSTSTRRDTSGIKLAALMRGTGPEPVLDSRRSARMVAVEAACRRRRRPAPSPPSIYTVEAIRAAKRGEEVVQLT